MPLLRYGWADDKRGWQGRVKPNSPGGFSAVCPMPVFQHVVLCGLFELVLSIAAGLPLGRLLATERSTAGASFVNERHFARGPPHAALLSCRPRVSTTRPGSRRAGDGVAGLAGTGSPAPERRAHALVDPWRDWLSLRRQSGSGSRTDPLPSASSRRQCWSRSRRMVGPGRLPR